MFSTREQNDGWRHSWTKGPKDKHKESGPIYGHRREKVIAADKTKIPLCLVVFFFLFFPCCNNSNNIWWAESLIKGGTISNAIWEDLSVIISGKCCCPQWARANEMPEENFISATFQQPSARGPPDRIIWTQYIGPAGLTRTGSRWYGQDIARHCPAFVSLHSSYEMFNFFHLNSPTTVSSLIQLNHLIVWILNFPPFFKIFKK